MTKKFYHNQWLYHMIFTLCLILFTFDYTFAFSPTPSKYVTPGTKGKCGQVEAWWEYVPVGSTEWVCVYGATLPLNDIVDDFGFTEFMGGREIYEGVCNESNGDPARTCGISGSGHIQGNKIIWGDISGNGNCVKITQKNCENAGFNSHCAHILIAIQPKKDSDSGGFSNLTPTFYFKYPNENQIRTNKPKLLNYSYSNCLSSSDSTTSHSSSICTCSSFIVIPDTATANQAQNYNFIITGNNADAITIKDSHGTTYPKTKLVDNKATLYDIILPGPGTTTFTATVYNTQGKPVRCSGSGTVSSSL